MTQLRSKQLRAAFQICFLNYLRTSSMNLIKKANPQLPAAPLISDIVHVLSSSKEQLRNNYSIGLQQGGHFHPVGKMKLLHMRRTLSSSRGQLLLGLAVLEDR